jgi:hypothetical protein
MSAGFDKILLTCKCFQNILLLTQKNKVSFFGKGDSGEVDIVESDSEGLEELNVKEIVKQRTALTIFQKLQKQLVQAVGQ